MIPRKLRTAFLISAIALTAVFSTVPADAQNLYVSGFGRIYEFTPSGSRSTYYTAELGHLPRGLAFDQTGNLFVAFNVLAGDGTATGEVLKFSPLNNVTLFATVPGWFLEGVAIDGAGNVYVSGYVAPFAPPAPINAAEAAAPHVFDIAGSVHPSAIFRFTPNGQRTVFGVMPGQTLGLAFDHSGNLYATDSPDQTIFKFAPNGRRTVFVGPDAFSAGLFPIGLVFDAAGNLFVSAEADVSFGAGAILEFTPAGLETTFATGLTVPRQGLAFDGSGNLFVSEFGLDGFGDILEFGPGGGPPAVFASGFIFPPLRPTFLAFGPPR